MEPDEQIEEFDGFTSENGKHQVTWDFKEVGPSWEYEVWWCQTHDKLYYGGCTLDDKESN